MKTRYTIEEIVQATGLEECEIRFFEQVFREFLTFDHSGVNQSEFTQDHIDILHRIKSLIHDRGRSVEQVKRDLKAAMQNHVAAGEFVDRTTDAPLTPFGAACGSRSFHQARVIAITSGKGGVGKTSVTVNLALAFARAGKKVAIFDADLGLANVHILMGVKARLNLRHVLEDNYQLEDVVTEGPEGIKIISGGQGVREMANLGHAQRRALLRQIDLIEREVDILLIDTGAGISENVLRFATYADEIIVVTTSNIAAAADGYSVIKILREMEPDSKIGLITNMVQNMYHSKNVFNRIAAAVKKHLHYSLGDLGYIVNDPHIETACQARRPLMLSHPDCESAKCIRSIADTILNTEVFVNDAKDSAFGDLMGQLKRSVVGA